MKAYDVSAAELTAIVDEVSRELYGGNVTLRDIADASNTRGPRATFTLRVVASNGPGHRHSRGYVRPTYAGDQGRHMPAACWHVHRDVLAAVFARFPEARVSTAVADYRGADGFAATFPATGTRNIGSMMSPVAFREACHCEVYGSWTEEHGPDAPARRRYRGETWEEPRPIVFQEVGPDMPPVTVRVLRSSDIGRCPFVIFSPEHYGPDGRCLCTDPAERERMMREWDYTEADFRAAGLI